MPICAYELDDEYAGNVTTTDDDGNEVETDQPLFEGGLLAVPDGREFDVREALDQGDGVIVIDQADQHLNTVLQSFHALKPAPVPEGATATVNYRKLKKHQLVELAEQQGLEVTSEATKAALVEALEGQGGND